MTNDFDQRLEAAGERHAAGDVQGASKIYAALLQEQPDNDIVLYFNALAEFDLGQRVRAIDVMMGIVQRLPDIAKIRSELAKMLEREGRYKEALEHFQAAIRLEPRDIESLILSGHMYLQLGDPASAANAYQRSLEFVPDNHPTRVAFAKALMLLGDWHAAFRECSRVLEAQPGHTGAMALQSVNCFELGKADEARAIMDFENRLMPRTFRPDGGLEQMNIHLADAIRNHPTIAYEPKDYSTRRGYHTGDITGDTSGPIFELLNWVHSEIDAVIAACRQNPDSPFAGRAPASYHLNAWGVVMEDQGHQDSHIHRDAWLSGVYYVKVPPSVTADDPDCAGWIEFGTPHDYPLRKTVSDTKLIMPEAGNSILFPAYFYHRTVPLRSSETRISIAFDVIPQE